MSPAHVQEPTYLGLKSRLRLGVWPMGMRIDAARLADELGVSITPVRDGLNRLAGERLVEFLPGEGYRVPRLSERLLRDMLVFNRDILTRAVAATSVRSLAAGRDNAAASYADRIAGLFSRLAAGTANALVIESVESLNDRLHPARCLEPNLVEDCAFEAENLAKMLDGNAAPGAVECWLADYHDRRCERAADYVQRLEKGPFAS